MTIITSGLVLLLQTVAGELGLGSKLIVLDQDPKYLVGFRPQNTGLSLSTKTTWFSLGSHFWVKITTSNLISYAMKVV